MATWWNDFKNSVLQGLSLSPENQTATVNGAGVDMKESQEGLFAQLSIGAVTGTNPTLDVTLEESLDDAVADPYTAITDFITGNPAAYAQKTDADADSMEALNFKRSKRFVRAVATIAGTTPDFTMAVSLHGMRRRVL